MRTIGVLVPYRSDPEMIAFVEEHRAWRGHRG